MEKLNELNDRPASEAVYSLTDILADLWRGRKLIASGTARTVVLGLSGAMYLSKYKSVGFLQFGGAIPLSQEKTQKH